MDDILQVEDMVESLDPRMEGYVFVVKQCLGDEFIVKQIFPVDVDAIEIKIQRIELVKLDVATDLESLEIGFA
jgi:hypothetical protein